MTITLAILHSVPPGRTAALAVALALLAAGCSRSPGSSAAAGRTHTYWTRAEILRLPAPGVAGSKVVVRHEQIDDYLDENGTVVGMEAMEMSFALTPELARRLAEGDRAQVRVGGNYDLDVYQPVSAPGPVAVGDKVLIRFTVNHERSAMVVEELDALAPATVLRLWPGTGEGQLKDGTAGHACGME